MFHIPNAIINQFKPIRVFQGRKGIKTEG